MWSAQADEILANVNISLCAELVSCGVKSEYSAYVHIHSSGQWIFDNQLKLS